MDTTTTYSEALAALSEFIRRSYSPNNSTFTPDMFKNVLRKFTLEEEITCVTGQCFLLLIPSLTLSLVTPRFVTSFTCDIREEDDLKFLISLMNQVDDDLLKLKTTENSDPYILCEYMCNTIFSL